MDSLLGKLMGRKAPPVDDVVGMRSQGMPDNVIFQNLMQAGFSQEDVQSAMQQADLKMGMGAAPGMGPPGFGPNPYGMGPPPMGPPGFGPDPYGMGPPPMGPPGFGPDPYGMGPPPMGPPGFGPDPYGMGPPPMGPPGFGPDPYGMGPPPMGAPGSDGWSPPQAQAPAHHASREQNIEGMVEVVVDEKWRDAEARLDDLEDFRVDLHGSMDDIRDDLTDLKTRFVELQDQSTVRLEEYGRSLEAVNAQINALQHVLQRLFPNVAMNVRELSEVVRDMKRMQAVAELQAGY